MNPNGTINKDILEMEMMNQMMVNQLKQQK